MLEIKDLKDLHDKAYQANQITREQASDDLVFYWVSQWDDQLLNDSQLQYRGQFDIVRKAVRQILSALKQNPVQPDFKPKNETRNDDAELMDGIYRAADRSLSSQEAYDMACQDQVVCGFGAWELFTEYETNQIGDMNQVIRRRFIPEANNNCFFDPNSVKLDKSDANYVSILFKYSEGGYMDLVEELTGERPQGAGWQSFSLPEESYTFPWISEQKKIYVTTFYHRKKVKDKVILFEDPTGQELSVRESQVNDVMDELVSEGYNVKDEKEIERWEVTRYIASGKEILEEKVIAGENIPVVAVFGEKTSVEGEEYYEGVVRLAKDAQRLRNFQMSYLADIVSRSPRNKPMFFAEQVQGYEQMFEESGSENNYPYYLLNRKTATGEDLPQGIAGQMPDQGIPPALAASIQLSREAVEDVANAGLPQNLSDPDLSGKAVLAIQNTLDMQSYVFQHNFKFAKRRDAEIFASMASEILDTPRTMMIETPDGQTKQVTMMETVVDSETGEPVVINDLTNMEFDVYAEIGQNYQSQKQQTREDLINIASALDPSDPLKNVVTMKAIELMDGVALDDVRDYVHKQLLIQGIKKPETPEDEQIVAEAQQGQKPDPMMLMAEAEIGKAEAEQLKGKASVMREQRGAQNDEQELAIKRTDIQIDAFKAETDRTKVMLEAREKDITIKNRSIEADGKLIDNQLKEVELADRAMDDQVANASIEDLVSMMTGA